MVTSAHDSETPARAVVEHAFRLPLPGYPRAVLTTDLQFRGGKLTIDGERVLSAETRDELEEGLQATWGQELLPVRLVVSKDDKVTVTVGDEPALREEKIWAKPSKSAWIHALIALLGSAAGFLASFFYLAKAQLLDDPWALKMGNHMAGWHILLTLTLFPASVWGQRFGIRAVQVVSFVFFCIHLGIALANSDLTDPPIAFFNALSGVLFLASTFYGSRAHRDMDPNKALQEGRV